MLYPLLTLTPTLYCLLIVGLSIIVGSGWTGFVLSRTTSRRPRYLLAFVALLRGYWLVFGYYRIEGVLAS